MSKSSKVKKADNYQLLVCNCENTMSIDAKKLGKDLGLSEAPDVHSHLCRSQLASFEDAVAKNPDRKTIIACTQEAPLFQELASEVDECDLTFVNIRETAGWSKSGKKATAKIAALIAESAFDITPTGLIPLVSKGACVVYGAGQQAMDIATKLSDRLSVSLLLTDCDDIFVPLSTQFPVYKGSVSRVSGAMGRFKLTIENHAAMKPSSKDELKFHNHQAKVEISSDLIFDLSGNAPLVGAQHGRDGYVHVDPENLIKTAEAMFDIVDLVGEFEKPLYVSYDKTICAHSRNGKTGCSNCIDNCPTSAITSEGDGVFVYSKICDGCGYCSASCPTGAMAYAFPNRSDLIGRCQTLISTYLNAGGKNSVLLVHEEDHGGKLISAMARFGDGLAENVLPLSVHSITHIGHDVLSGFFTTGVQTVVVLAPMKKRDDLDVLNFQIDLTNTFLRAMKYQEGIQVQLLDEDNPDIVAASLAEIPAVKMPKAKNFTASRNKRETARLALANLNAMAPETLKVLKLPENSPYGKVSIDPQLCTLCLSCVGACPASALGDNEDRPQVTFSEHACVQCGLCKATCPENAISLSPQYNFDKSALSPIILNSEEPLECTKCGKPFGSKSAIEKVIGILSGKNPMFQSSEQLALLKMCDNCRVITMTETQKDPMTLGVVPKTMTADDYLPEDDEPTKH